MPHAPLLSSLLLLSLSLTLLLSSTPTNAHNITRILAKHPDLSTFNHYLTLTHLAGEINRRQTITVLALDNAAMSSLLSKHLSLYTLRNVLSLHVLVDYFGTKKLHQITDGTTSTSTMFQATGAAPGTSGYVNITDLKGGKVGFGAVDSGNLDATYVKSIEELPYNISVLQISHPLTSAEAEAPTAAPSLNLTTIMNKQGCKAFADLLIASGAITTFEQSVDGGLTVFCPPDKAVNAFMPKYKNLTATQKVSFLLFHGIPIYFSLQMLKSNNGIMNTLATDGSKKYDFTVQTDGEDITLKTKVDTVSITGTVKDEEPLVIYEIDKFLMPRELFKGTVADEPAPAPAPKAAKKKKKSKNTETEADSPDVADGPADDSADATADDEGNGVAKMNGGRLAMILISLCLGLINLV